MRQNIEAYEKEIWMYTLNSTCQTNFKMPIGSWDKMISSKSANYLVRCLVCEICNIYTKMISKRFFLQEYIYIYKKVVSPILVQDISSQMKDSRWLVGS